MRGKMRFTVPFPVLRGFVFWLVCCGTIFFGQTFAHAADSSPFVHPGLLVSDQDLIRAKAKVAAGEEPWMGGWKRLLANPHAQADWRPDPQDIVYRGSDGQHAENYQALYNDAAAAYALALRWKISGDAGFAQAAVGILNAWSARLAGIAGTSDRYLAAGLSGYQLANAAEILRAYPKWAAGDFKRLQQMLLSVFYPMNHDFLTGHNGSAADHYWANWDLANMASMLAIGVLADRRDIYQEAISYFRNGAGNGSIRHLVWTIYTGGLGQVQEAGRDQGHSMLDIALAGVFCQMAWTQGDDLFAYADNRILSGAEYVARYNLGETVPYTPYTNGDVAQPAISKEGRGDLRPVWELLYNHYVVLKGLPAPGIEAMAVRLRPEGGGGDYGPDSGGFDQLGYGTLTFSLK